MGRTFLKRKEGRDGGGYVENVNSIKTINLYLFKIDMSRNLLKNKVDATLVVF